MTVLYSTTPTVNFLQSKHKTKSTIKAIELMEVMDVMEEERKTG